MGLALAVLMASGAAATPLDKAACAKLAQDIQAMKALDLDRLMERGPNWAAANLSASDLDLVRQYIELDEQMKFRCMAPSSLVQLKNLEEEDEDGVKPQAGPDTTPAAADVKPASGQPKAKATATPQAQKAKTPAPVQAGVVNSH